MFPKPRPRKQRPKAFDGDGPNGSTAWFLGLIAVLLPGLGAILAGPVMTLYARREAPANDFARENCRRAANWGLTYSVLTVLFFIVHFGAWWALAARGVELRGMGVLGFVALLWLLLSAVHVGICMVGGLRAKRGEDFEWKASLKIFE